MDALKSRSCLVPQLGHTHVLSDRVKSWLTYPHTEQVLELGSNMPILSRFLPYQSVLYCRNEKNIPSPKSWICRANLWFFNIFETLRVSTHSVWFSRTKRVETLWRKSFLWLCILSWRRASFLLTLIEFLEGGFLGILLREKFCWSFLSLGKEVLRNLGLLIYSPLEQVAKVLIPTSMPMVLLLMGISLVGVVVPSSTNMETKYL